MPLVWAQSPQLAFVQLSQGYEQAIHALVRGVIASYRPQIENWMRANAPWTDRSGNARRTLHTEYDEAGRVFTLWIAHGMDYGLWLEIRFAGRFAIIGPAIDHFAPQIMAELQRRLR